MKIIKTALKMTVVSAALVFCVSGGGAPAGAVEPSILPPAAARDWHETVRLFAAGHFKHPAWGFSHAVRTYQLARKLAAADKVAIDEDVLYAAAYLHDMAAFPPWAKDKIDHAEEAARAADTLLRDTGFPMGKMEAVRGAIRTHMFERTPAGAEAVYLHDADALDWLGAIGAARFISLVDPNGGVPDGPAMIRSLEGTIALVTSRVFSPAGRALAPARKAESEKFLKELRAESDDLKTL